MAKTDNRGIKYNDYRFPIELLRNAYNILETYGTAEFRGYANRVRMPTEDIERVLSKYNYNHDDEFRNRINQIIKNIGKMIEKGKSDLKMEVPWR